MGSKCKTSFSGPTKDTSLRETTSFDLFICLFLLLLRQMAVEIGIAARGRELEEPEKANLENIW